MRTLDRLLVVTLFLWPVLAWAQALPMVTRPSLFQDRAPLIEAEPRRGGNSPSLFAGQGAQTLFAIVAPTALPPAPDGLPFVGAPHVNARLTDLRALIASAEAGVKGYNAVQYGARITTPRPPTRMTVQQIYDWIDATPGQPHAIGRYQFIPATLRRLVQHLGVDPRSRFSPALQDRLADQLLAEAGLHRFLGGDMARHDFMNNLAKIWAGLPNDSGKSHYHGYAGNKATITWARFDAEMARIFAG